MGNVFGIFPTNILVDNFKEGVNSDQMNFIMDREWLPFNKINPNLRSYETDILNSDKLKNIRKFIEQNISNYALNVMGLIDVELYVTQSWLNRNSTGKDHHIHNHPNSIISGVFYVQCKPDTGAIRFHKEMSLNRTIHFSECSKTEFNAPYFDFNVNSNDLILFPSTLSHSVNINTDLEDRISIAFNTFVRGSFGSIDGLTRLELK